MARRHRRRRPSRPRRAAPPTMTHQAPAKRPFAIHDLESVARITSLPIVESGWSYAEHFYKRIKTSNNLIYWTLQRAETSLQTAVGTALPAIVLLEAPITSIDKILCMSLDIVEKRVPSISLPPEMIYWNTKRYVTDVSSKIVRPVLKRADSVKQIGNTVLASKYTAFAADTLDGALSVADKYVDRFLPAAVYDDQASYDETDNDQKSLDGPAGKAIHTMHHVGRFSGKLQRRLTRRTLAEAKALKEQSAEAIHVLLYVAELIATDPKQAYVKGKELWASLSKDEPENQARPENLEQLIVLLTRETARRVVHLVNFTGGFVSKIPKQLTNSVLGTIQIILSLADSIVKTAHLDGVQEVIIGMVVNRAHQFTLVLKQVNIYLTDVLDNMAQSLSNQEQSKTALKVPRIEMQFRGVHTKKNTNGVDTNSN